MSANPKSPRQFDLSLQIAADPDRVWKAISEADRVAQWFAPEVDMDTRPGGAVAWRWPNFYEWPLSVDEVREGEALRMRYESSVETEDGAAPLFIDWELQGRGGTTTLRLVHHGFGPGSEFDQEYDGISQGWPIELRSLRLYVEKHYGRRRHVAQSQVFLDLDLDEAWQRLTGPDGLACGAKVRELAEGDALAFTSVDGDAFEGDVLCTFERAVCARLSSHGDAFFRAGVEVCGGHPQVWLWLATYGDEPETALKQRWDAMLERLFAEHRVTVEAPTS